MVVNLNELLDKVEWFLLIVLADIVAIAVWWLSKERVDSKISFRHRMRSWRFNCLAILHKEYMNAREVCRSHEEVQRILKKKYATNSFPFMNRFGSTPDEGEDIIFIGKVIDNTEALFHFMSIKSFGKKEYEGLLKLMNIEEEEKIAREAVRSILMDQSKLSVDSAMRWLPKLFTPPFVKDPDNSEKKIKKLENHFSVLYYTKDVYINRTVSQDSFIRVLNALHRINPSMEYASSKAHAASYEKNMRKDDKRCEAILAQIRSICAEKIDQSKVS